MLHALGQPSLRRSLVLGTLAVAVLPLFVLAAAGFYVSDRVVLDGFHAESETLAAAAASDIDESVARTTRSAILISEIRQTREAFSSRDQRAIRGQLSPLRSRLGLAIVNFAGPDGAIIAGAQDPTANAKLPSQLLVLAQAGVESAWLIDEDENGALVIWAIATVRTADEVIGIVLVGSSLDRPFLQSVQGGPDRTATPSELRPQLAVMFRNSVRASTVDLPALASFPPAEAIDADPGKGLRGNATIGGREYQAVYTLIETHQQDRLILGVFFALAPVESAHRTILRVLAGLIAVLIVLIGYVAYRFASRVTRPLAALAAAALRIEAGDLDTSVERRSANEVGTLERAFDTMRRALRDREDANRALMADLQVQALNDALTGLPNRMLLQDRLRQTIAASKRRQASFAFFMVDLDGFKDVNDSFGHQVGDRVLVAVGERFRTEARDSDTVARFGGDEFALVLPTAATVEEAIGLATRLARVLEAPVMLGDMPLHVEASIGITMYPQHGEDASTLVKRADAAMYVAKRAKTGYAVYQATEEVASRDRLALMGDFRGAIERSELVLYYQPEVHPRTGVVFALEALVRWRHPSRGLLGPDAFIPFAEQTGIIRPLTQWVVAAALAQLRVWRDAGHDIRIAVNISARDFDDPLLPGQIGETLRHAGISPGHLKLEITEGVVMTESAHSVGTLAALHDMGVHLSMDDFGTGYSSLSYLKRLPVDEIKIDRSFVADISADLGSAAIVRSTIALAHELGRSVVAEGVEDRTTADLLANFGCDAVQGYFYGRPVSAADADANFASGAWVLGNDRRAPPAQRTLVDPGRISA